MLLIVAALEEELRVVREICRTGPRIAPRGLSAWRAKRHDKDLCLMKCGMGPEAAGLKLRRFLETQAATKILSFGYAGALESDLKIGNLLMVRRAILLGSSIVPGTPLERMEPTGTWDLADGELQRLAISAGMAIRCGDIITTPFIVGGPGQRILLREKFHAAAVDMETAALAEVAASFGAPFISIRGITDEADDTLLAPLSYDPSANLAGKAMKVVAAGHWVRRYAEWARRASEARQSLRRFLTIFLDTYIQPEP